MCWDTVIPTPAHCPALSQTNKQFPSLTAATTSFVQSFVYTCPCRLRDTPVSVYALHPGAVDTPLSRQLLPPVVTHVIFALASWLQVLKDPDQVGSIAQLSAPPSLTGVHLHETPPAEPMTPGFYAYSTDERAA